MSGTAPEPFAGESLGRQMLRGSGWMIAMRWSMRGIGLVSTVVLARLLTPEDFGIVAMAMVVVGLMEVFSWTGVDLALIRDREAGRADYDSAWTIQVGIGAAIAVALLLVAPLAPLYFEDPRVEPVIQVLALRGFIAGFENIGTVEFRKRLQFAREYRFWVYRKLCASGLAIAAAIAIGSYWALVLAMLGTSVILVALSYGMHPYRPRFALSRVRAIWSFSRWVLAFSVVDYFNRRFDEIAVGGFAGAVSMGHYFIASDIAKAPINEIVVPMGRALHPVYATALDRPEALRQAYLGVLGMVAMVCGSIAVGLALVAPDLVDVVLGEKWRQSVPLMRWLTLGAGTFALMTASEAYFTALGRVRAYGLLKLAHLALFALLAVAGARWAGLEAVAAARVAAAAIGLPLLFVLVTRIGPVRLGDIAAVLWRPALACAGMALLVPALHPDSWNWPAARLGVDIAVGVVGFGALSLLLWGAAGRPEGAERTLLRLAGAAVRRWRPAAGR